MEMNPRCRVRIKRLDHKEVSEIKTGEECIDSLKTKYILVQRSKAHGGLHFMRYVYRNAVVKNADEIIFTEDNSDDVIIKDADLNPGCIIISSDTDFIVARNACVLDSFSFMYILKRRCFTSNLGESGDKNSTFKIVRNILGSCEVMTRDYLRLLFNLKEDNVSPESGIKQIIDCTRVMSNRNEKTMTVTTFLSKFDVDESPFMNA